jgi:prepilin-type N-terminal cleavage/methylation domain-containing protein
VLSKIPGFSLLEMAIVLIIMGVIGSMTLPALKIMLDNQRAKTTAQRQELILYALASYANQYKILPYAADPTNPTGTEDKSTQRRRGIVPYAALGLPETIARDGYHNWFTYVVDDYFATMPEMSIPGSVSHPLVNKLCQTYIHQNALYIKGLAENIAIALISHGPEGRGAYPNTLANPPRGKDEEQNATSDQEIIDRPMSLDPLDPFSHKVVWVTSRNLIAIYGHAPCPPPRELIPQSGKSRYELPQNNG